MIRLAVLASHPVQYYSPLYRALAQRFDLTVFYCHDSTSKDQAQAGFGVEFDWDVDLLSGYRYVFLTNVARRPGLEKFWGVDTPEIGERLLAGQFEIVLIMGWYVKSLIQALIAAKRHRIPTIVRGDSHLETPRSVLTRYAKRALYPFFLRRYDAALFVGIRNQAYWEYYNYPTEKMFYAPHCVDDKLYSQKSVVNDRDKLRDNLKVPRLAKLVLFAGKLVPIKRPLDVILGVERIRAAGVRAEVLIAGAGLLESEVRTLAKSLNVPLHMVGFQNQSKMPALYAAADVVVLPSERETWGVVVNEALACGTPVVVSDSVGCAPDLASLLGSQTVFRSGDVVDMGKKLACILESPPSSEVLAKAAYRFHPESVAIQIHSACKTVLEMR